MENFDLTKAVFAQVDANRDGVIDPREFQNWVSQNSGGAGFSSSSFESSAFQSSGSGAEASSAIALSGGAEAAGFGGSSGYEAAAFSSQSGIESASGFAAGGFAGAGADASFAGASLSGEFAQASGSTVESTSVQQTTQYASAGGLFNDPNPQIIRRAATEGPVTYQQKILVRFFQPPPVPPPGPLIIKEVRPPQPPPPPPLVVRQRAPALPQPPPLILRERPPAPPASAASQTVIRRLPALPVPPRSVIIERLPPLPPKPRDIIIERWVPYGAQAKRRTIVQRAAAAKDYPKPRNIIIAYDVVQVRVVRQFQRLGVVQENPQAYASRYGVSLLDASTLVQQARAAGVVEDISPPATGGVAVAQSSASSFEASANYGASASQSFSSSAEGTGLEGLEVIGGAEAGTYGLRVASDAAGAGNYSSQSFSSSAEFGAEGGFAGGAEGGFAGGAEGGFAGGAGFNFASAAFASADRNSDGRLDQAEFQRFVQGGY